MRLSRPGGGRLFAWEGVSRNVGGRGYGTGMAETWWYEVDDDFTADPHHDAAVERAAGDDSAAMAEAKGDDYFDLKWENDFAADLPPG